jgi:hypothetical protein
MNALRWCVRASHWGVSIIPTLEYHPSDLAQYLVSCTLHCKDEQKKAMHQSARRPSFRPFPDRLMTMIPSYVFPNKGTDEESLL